LSDYARTGNPYAGSEAPNTAGNGALMRLAPVPMFYFGKPACAIEYAVESARTTHAAPEALETAVMFCEVLLAALAGRSKEHVLTASNTPFTQGKVIALQAGAYRAKAREHIRGTGYCVESLEAALWCFAHTASFEDAVLAAANLGDDADTTAAIVGQVAGAHYGTRSIPSRWLQRLAWREDIAALADRLLAACRHPIHTDE
jgi:ADP-ribosyl-[dinitrogen reductase] hydrolase